MVFIQLSGVKEVSKQHIWTSKACLYSGALHTEVQLPKVLFTYTQLAYYFPISLDIFFNKIVGI